MSRSGAQPSRTPVERRVRRLPIGAEPVATGRIDVRLWAPTAQVVTLEIGARSVPLERETDGYWHVETDGVAGDRYGFRIDGSEKAYPDPASRYQPDGPHERSQVIDSLPFDWQDTSWAGVSLEGQVIYELHVGTFTREGTWRAALRELQELRDLGVTTIELMPVAEFDGRFGWGYDGVNLFAPYHHYGTPDDLRAFVDEAHRVGLAVIVDVVYNHLGPSGNYLREFSPSYFSTTYDNEWGDALNFDGAGCGPVREFFIANAGYWIDEFHMDGLRLDATQQIFDASARHLIAALTAHARARAGTRRIIVVAENEPQLCDLVRPEADGGMGLDGLWNDDFHHSAMVALTGRAEAYYSDTRGTSSEFIAAAKYGYLFQGQRYHWQHQARGTAGLDLEPWRFVNYLQNHDQVANSVHGLRMQALAAPARVRALTALLLLMPGTPMLFQGQEFGASSPFLYFADHEPSLASAVKAGRAEFLTQFASAVDYERRARLDEPAAQHTFGRSTLDFSERQTHAGTYRLHRDLLRLRRSTPAFAAQRRGVVDGAAIADAALVLRFMLGGFEDRLLVVNLGADLDRNSLAEPLVAPPRGCQWEIEWSSHDPAYGGFGTPDLWPEGRWYLPADSAVVFRPAVSGPQQPGRKRRTA